MFLAIIFWKVYNVEKRARQRLCVRVCAHALTYIEFIRIKMWGPPIGLRIWPKSNQDSNRMQSYVYVCSVLFFVISKDYTFLFSLYLHPTHCHSNDSIAQTDTKSFSVNQFSGVRCVLYSCISKFYSCLTAFTVYSQFAACSLFSLYFSSFARWKRSDFQTTILFSPMFMNSNLSE